MISVPDIGHIYPKTGLDVDLRVDLKPRFVSEGSAWFDDTDDYVNCQDPANSQMAFEDFSVVYWAKTVATAEHFCVSKQDGGIYDGYRFGLEGGSYRCSIQVDGSNKTGDVNGNAIVNDGAWHHFAFTVDRGSNLLCYVDGQLDKTVDISSISGTIDPAEDLILGASYSGGSQNFGGNLCNVGIYKGTVLDHAEIRSIMGATTYAQTAAVVTPSLFYLLAADYTDSTGNQDATNVGSILVGDRARLPNGFDLTGNRISGRCFSGRAVTLDGTGDYIKLDGFSFDSTGAWTIESWMKLDTPSAARFWFAIGDANELTCYYSTGVAGNIGFYPDGVEDAYGSALPFCDGGTWHHWCLSVGAGASATAVLYIDGKQYATSTVTCTDISSEPKFRFAADANGNSSLDGSIAGIKVVVGTAYSAAQALEAYQIPEQLVPSGVTSSHLKCWLGSDYTIPASSGIDGLYLQDASGNGNHAVMVNGATEWNQHTIPQLGLQSSSTRVLLNNTSGKQASATLESAPGTTFSVACWFQEFANDDTNIIWRMGGTTATDDDFLELYLNSSGQLQVYGDGSVTAGSPTIGEWHHVVVVSDGSSPYCKVYVDNSEITTSGALGQAVDISTATLIIGDQAPTLAAFPFDGIIGEVAVWDSVLTSGNVSTLFNSGVQGVDANTVDGGNLLNWYRCDNPAWLINLSNNSTNEATYAGYSYLATIPEGPTAGLSSFGAITSKRPRWGMSGSPGIINNPGRNSMELSSPLDWGTGNWTFSFWVQHTGWFGAQSWILGDILNSGIRIQAYKYSNSWRFAFIATDGTTSTPTMVSSLASADELNNWTFICFRRAGTALWKITVKDVDGNDYSPVDNTTSITNTITSDSIYNLRLNGGHTSDSARSDYYNPYCRGSDANITNFRAWVGEAITDEEVDALWVSGARTVRGT